MDPFASRLIPVMIEEDLPIPSLNDPQKIAHTIRATIPALRDPKDGEIYFNDESTRAIDRARARHMGLLSAEEMKALRLRHGLTQKLISQLFQMGEKTWTRWESGKDFPSRSLNLLLCAFRDRKVDVDYLLSQNPNRDELDVPAFSSLGFNLGFEPPRWNQFMPRENPSKVIVPPPLPEAANSELDCAA